MSFHLTLIIITAMCSAATNKALCGVTFSWVQYKKRHEASKLAQVYELHKLACQAFLTFCCVGAMKSTAISLHVSVENLIVPDCCKFGLLAVNISLGGDTWNWRHVEVCTNGQLFFDQSSESKTHERLVAGR
jgi:hypothetical protein